MSIALFKRAVFWLGLLAVLAKPVIATASEFEIQNVPFLDQFAPIEFNGFIEGRSGMRMQGDTAEQDFSMGEVRLQGEAFTYTDWADFKYKGDVRADGVTSRMCYETRELWMFSRPTEYMDIKVGRQVHTWGTGGLVFVNDLFPKDWRSFFLGRDAEYLKAPSTSAKMSLFSEVANLDMIYTPRFESDRFIDGQYISYWSGLRHERVGNDHILNTDIPDKWFEDDEFSARVYQNVHNYELALYGYWGYWKKPSGMNSYNEATFPALNVYGASARGQVGAGIGNIEFAWYDSVESHGGNNPDVAHSQNRYLIGYAQELWTDSNCEVQYYIEQMLDYDKYKKWHTSYLKDEFRHVATVQLTQTFMNQNLTLGLDGYICPSDEDAYLRPYAQYKVSDQTTIGAGMNVFLGERDHTFFGQFENNSNVYVSLRYCF
ncbi:MAG: hypothetical protein ACNI27_06735 [Desulfovibrio sp.]